MSSGRSALERDRQIQTDRQIETKSGVVGKYSGSIVWHGRFVRMVTVSRKDFNKYD